MNWLSCTALLLLAVLIGCSRDRQAPVGEAERGTASSAATHELDRQAPVPYVVIDSQIVPGLKRSLTIGLESKVSADTLRLLAEHLYVASPRYHRTFMEYLLPGMEPGAGAWATTHFVPDLDVRVLGSTAAQDELMATKAQATSLPGTRLGEWVDVRSFGNGTIVLYRDGSTIHMQSTYPDGSQGATTLQVGQRDGREAFLVRQSSAGDYFQIDADGNLRIYDQDGLITTARPAR